MAAKTTPWMDRKSCVTLLYVKDVSASVKFYREVLAFGWIGYWDDETHGYSPTHKGPGNPGYARVRAGLRIFGLHLLEGKKATAHLGAGVIHHFQVRDVDGFHRRVRKHGVAAKAPVVQPWGWKQFYMKDPSGHVLSFYSI